MLEVGITFTSIPQCKIVLLMVPCYVYGFHQRPSNLEKQLQQILVWKGLRRLRSQCLES